jgi:hypothetical protein
MSTLAKANSRNEKNNMNKKMTNNNNRGFHCCSAVTLGYAGGLLVS